jgi:hypothetical protein
MNSRQRKATKRQADYEHPITIVDVAICVGAGMFLFTAFLQALAWAAGAR